MLLRSNHLYALPLLFYITSLKDQFSIKCLRPMGKRTLSSFSACSACKIAHSTLYSMVLTIDISDSTAARSFTRRLLAAVAVVMMVRPKTSTNVLRKTSKQ